MARDAQRRVLRTYHLPTNILFCESCDGFHIIFDKSRIKIPQIEMELLRLKAQGFQRPEIAKELGVKPTAVEYHTRQLFRTFGAMSSAHLIAISIAVRALSPAEFIPAIVPIPAQPERTNDARKPDNRIRKPGRRKSASAVR
jgi:DNA-binding CsgD family transcriptional regulator